MLHELTKHHWELGIQPPDDLSQARVLAFVGDDHILSPSPEYWQWLTLQQLPERYGKVFLGCTDDIPWFAVQLEEALHGFHEIGARQAALAGETEFGMISRGKQLLYWHKYVRFCARCGTELERSATENATHCPGCHHVSYPTIAPCMIVLVTRGDEILLSLDLRRKDTGMYSTLAGFIEPGESVEQAVQREIFEEVGVRVKTPAYRNSQTWPFPHQLMMGFEAEWESGEIRLQEDEVLDAKWFHIEDELPLIAPEFTIAGWLIREYMKRRRALNNA